MQYKVGISIMCTIHKLAARAATCLQKACRQSDHSLETQVVDNFPRCLLQTTERLACQPIDG